jgi:hypothetical protein
MLGVVMLLTAASTAIAWPLSFRSRLVVPAGALAIEVIGLWLSGHGPWFHVTSGQVVRLLYGAMLTLAVLLVVTVPFTALWVKHGAAAARARLQTSQRRTAMQPMTRGPVIPR